MNYVTADELLEIVNDIWMPVLNHSATVSVLGAETEPNSLTASIDITGAWQGSVQLQCSRHLLDEAAAVVFDVEQSKVTDHDRTDTLLELTNMLGGIIKILLPAPSHLAFSSIEDAKNRDAQEQPTWQWFTSHNEPFAVAITPFKSDDFRTA